MLCTVAGASRPYLYGDQISVLIDLILRHMNWCSDSTVGIIQSHTLQVHLVYLSYIFIIIRQP